MEKKSNMGLYIIIIILCVALTVAVCYILFKKDGGPIVKQDEPKQSNVNNDNKSTTQNINEKNEIVLTEVQKSKFENYDKIFIDINSNMLDVSDQINKTDYLVYNINLFDNPDSRFYFALFTIDSCTDGDGEGSKECNLDMFKNYYYKLFDKEFKEDEVRIWRMDKIENNKIYGTLPSGYVSTGVWNSFNKVICNNSKNDCSALYDLNEITFDNNGNEIKKKVGEGKLDYIQNNDGTITIKSYIITK